MKLALNSASCRGPRRIRLADDRGITLVELLVYMVLSGLVLSILGGLLINSIRTQATIRSASEANTSGQLVLRTIESGIRNASAVRVSGAGTLLVIRTAEGTDDWICRAWWYDPADDGAVYMKQGANATALGIAAAPSGWTMLAEQAGVGLASLFSPESTSGPSTTAVSVELNLLAKDSANVALKRTIAPRLTGAAEAGACFT